MADREPDSPAGASAPGTGHPEGSADAVAPVGADAVTDAPPPDWQRGARARTALTKIAIATAQLLVVGAGLVVLWVVLGEFWVVLLPVILGLLFATVLWPATRFLRNHRWPPALAAAVVLLGALALFIGLIAAIAPQVVNQVEDLATRVTDGLQEVQTWLSGPPFNLGDGQIDDAVNQVINTVQSNAQGIAAYAATGAAYIGNTLLNLVLALLLTFFFLKDGPRWVPWLAAQTGPRAAPHVAALSGKAWTTLSEFIRQQALVGFVDAFFIGVGLLVLGVPLVIPLAVLTFFGAFIPIIGAFVAGGFAVLVALVSNGPQTALIVLIIVLVVQQLEGNVLQPIIQGRGLNLHAAVVILAVTAGSSLYGIIGAFLAVPVAALAAVVYRYTRDALDGKEPAATLAGMRPQLTTEGAPEGGTALTATPAAAARAEADGAAPAEPAGSGSSRRRR